MRLEFVSQSQKDTEEFAKGFAQEHLKEGSFVAFFGELGSGKTAFTRGIANCFCPDARVSSPTYAIVNEYRGSIDIYHFDMYRITDDDSLYSTGFYDYFDRNGIIVTEWSENIEFALPRERFDVTFYKLDENTRRIVIESK